MKLEIQSGQKIGRLTAINVAEKKRGKTCWTFKCDCGKERVALLSMVINGQTRSCGCLRKDSWKRKW